MGYDFFAYETVVDPFPVFARLREEDPVYATGFGYWYVSRYEDASRMLREPSLLAGRGVPDSMGITSGPLYDLMTTWMMAIDGPEHTRVRKLVSRAFTPRAVEAMRPQVQRVADELLDGMAGLPEIDLIADYAFPLPMEVVRVLFGVEPAEWSERVVALFDPARRAEPGMLGPMAALADWLGELVPRRRREPGPDVLSALLAPDEDGDSLSDYELVANGVLLITAGFETTMSLIALAALALLSHPDQLGRLRDDPSLARDAIEETLRFEPAALSTTRSTPTAIDVGGLTIPGGSNILFSFCGANRDPRQYHEPDHFEIGRTDIRPLTFGAGAHACLGAALARLEGEIAIGSFFARYDVALADGALVWQTENPTVRRPVALPMRLVPR